MTDRLPPLQWLRSFEASARHLSFTSAADQLGLTQSAVSQQIKSLEQFLGQPLFLRRPRSLQLTEAGRTFLPVVRQSFALLTEGTSTFLGDPSDSVVEIKANTAFSVFWLAPRLQEFLAANPSLQVNLSTAMWDDDFTGGYGSVEIRFGRGEWGGDPGDLLSAVSLFPVAAPDVARRVVAVDDLARETLLRIGAASYDWDHWLEALGKAHVAKQNHHTFNTYVLTLELARRGQGIAMGHDVLVGDLMRSGDLVRLFEHEVESSVGYYLLGPRHGQMNLAAQTFCAWLKRHFNG